MSYICHGYRSPIVRELHPRFTASKFDIYAECDRKLKSWLRITYGSEFLEFRLPMFFQAVLREARFPGEILSIAMQHREEAKGIRGLISLIHENSGGFNLPKYAEARRIADEETVKFQKKFGLTRLDKEKGPLSIELSVSPTSIEAKSSVDILKISKDIVRRIQERDTHRGVATIFKMAQKSYEVLSLEQDIKRLWKLQLTDSQKEFLRTVAEYADA